MRVRGAGLCVVALLVGCMTPLYEGARVEPGWHGAVGAAYLNDVPSPGFVVNRHFIGWYRSEPMSATRVDVSGVYGFDDRFGLTVSAGGGYGWMTYEWRGFRWESAPDGLSRWAMRPEESVEKFRETYVARLFSGYAGLKWNAVRANPSLALKAELGWPVRARGTVLLGWAYRGHEIATLGVQTALTLPVGVFVVLHRKVTARNELHLFLGHDLGYLGSNDPYGYERVTSDFVAGIGVGW